MPKRCRTMGGRSDFQDNPLASDLDRILSRTRGIWKNLRGKRIFITGGTGFFGCWLLESFAWANSKLNLKSSVLVLAKDKKDYNSFKKKAPHLAKNPSIKFCFGDLRSFKFPAGKFPIIIHAAATSAISTFKGEEDALTKFSIIFDGTKRVLDFAVKCRAEKILFTSSGAVYGKQPDGMLLISENYLGAIDYLDLKYALGAGKRAAEFLCSFYSKKYGFEAKIARCFAFVGPYLPLNLHYAIGNFIRDGLKKKDIVVKSDGLSGRSYLYVADLIIWLWVVLSKGKSCRPYNVGSEKEIKIRDLAKMIAKMFKPELRVKIMGEKLPGSLTDRYIPSTSRARKELGLKQEISLRDAIERTIKWNKSSCK